MKRIIAAILLFVVPSARGDILVRADNACAEGKVLSQSPTEILFQPADNSPPLHVPRPQISRILLTDDHGGVLPNRTNPAAPRPIPAPPPEPIAPPLAIVSPTGPTYYLIPLHGEVGATVLASALDKSLADAALRSPTVVVLDINSPGGLVEEAEKILKVLHHYNRQLRIVALTDQDLSAAAVITLSVREIYVKPSSTIGAAVSFVPSKLFLPPKLEEKFQSAWRAVARNSAEEGGHEPLLADAMIDPSVDLHIETAPPPGTGKSVVKEGPGERMLLHKGKILTLTSHEAVDCGLAAGEAEDLGDLGKQLHLDHWTECKGLGVPLGDYIAQRATLFKTEIDKINGDLANNLTKAQQADPNQSIRITFTHPRQPAAPPPPATRSHDPIADRVQWKQRSLAAVISLQDAEQNIQDAIAVSESFGQETAAETLKNLLAKIANARAAIYDNRNKFGEGMAITPGTSGTPASAKSLPRPNLPEQITTLADAELALASPDYDDQSRAARFLATAAVDPAAQRKIANALLPLFQGPDTNRQYLFMEAFAHWAAKDDVPVLVAILASPAKSGSDPNPQNRYWPPAITALVHLDPAAAEPILQQRKSEFYFRSKVSFALQTLIDGNSVDKPAAQHLLDILRPK